MAFCVSSPPLRAIAARAGPRSFNGGRFVTVAARAEGSNGNKAYDYDLVTIGIGSGGTRASRFSASYGAKVAAVELPFDYVSSAEKGGIGGTCVLRGCVPKKLMVFASEFAEDFKACAGFGWAMGEPPSYDLSKFMGAKRSELQRLNGAYKNMLVKAGVEVLEGRGVVVGPNAVDVGGKTVTAKNILISTGSTASKLNIPGAELTITSDEILELGTVPKKITVLGAGYIAVEFAGIFKRFGSEVHLVYRGDMPLRGFDNETRKFATEQYATTGLALHADRNPVEVKKQDDGRLTVVLRSAKGEGADEEITDNDVVLMATGRSPNTRGLGLEKAGVRLGKGGEVLVDEFSRTNVPSIWSIGDCTGKVQLTPVALMEGSALAATLFKDTPTKPDYAAIPSAVFSWPNLATVGLSEEQAVKEFGDVDIYTTSFRPMRNTVSGSPLRAFMKVVVDVASQKVVGMHMVGDEAGEIIQGFGVAVKIGVTKQQLDSTIGVHPTAAEEFVTLRTVSRQVRKAAAVAAAR